MNAGVGIESAGNQINDNILNRILVSCDVYFEASLYVNVEEHRIWWTTFSNLSLWFESWERTIVDKGFGLRDAKGSVIITPDQLFQIFNVDDSVVSLDGSIESQAGGFPTLTLHDKNLPMSGNPATKNSTKNTFIGGSNASGEPIPDHFQFPTGATIEENEKICINCADHLMSTWGRFVHDEVNIFPSTIGMNPKDGMNTTKLKKLFKNSYLPLYPDIADEPGKRVLDKLDSGPGQKYVSNTQARQEAIPYSKTHGQLFHATGG